MFGLNLRLTATKIAEWPLTCPSSEAYMLGADCALWQETKFPGPYAPPRELALTGLVGLDTWHPPTL